MGEEACSTEWHCGVWCTSMVQTNSLKPQKNLLDKINNNVRKRKESETGRSQFFDVTHEHTRNEYLDPLTPLEVINRGQIDRLWQIIHNVGSGMPT